MDTEYIHQTIDHAVSYVEGRMHTNGIENFWSLLKRMLRGTYVAVSLWRLFRYLAEEAYRFNGRKQNDGERFAEVMGRVVGKRIQYKRAYWGFGMISTCRSSAEIFSGGTTTTSIG